MVGMVTLNMTENEIYQMTENKKIVIAAIGDSVTAGSHISSDIGMLYRVWRGKKPSWFAELIKMIRGRKVEAFNFARAGGETSDIDYSYVIDKIARIDNMGTQVSEVLSLNRFPDLVLVWIGHNDLDWPEKANKDFSAIAAHFRAEFQKQLERLCAASLKADRKTVIVVFDFINIRALFPLREKAALARQKNPKLFPYLEKGYKMFPAIRPEYHEQTFQLLDMLKDELAATVADCQNKFQAEKLRLLCSDALSGVTTDSLEDLHPVDGWHPSASGHKKLAEAAWSIVKEQIEFLVK